MHEHNTYACFRVNYPFADICSVTRCLSSCYCRSKAPSFGQWAATDCAVPPTGNAGLTEM